MNLLDLNEIFIYCENKDKKLFEHMERVSLLCYAFGKELNLTPKELEIVYVAGLLHDIGKFYIDIEPECYSILSSSIINSFENEFNQVSNIILQIEENYDGTGKPLGLKTDKIKLLSYVIKISNLYDELRSSGLTHDESTQNIRANSNLLFPDQIITPFIKSIIKNGLQFEY